MSIILRSASTLLLAALVTAAAAQTETAPVVVNQNGAIFDQFCTEEGSITLVGSNNDATIDGPCATVTVQGSNNKVHIARTGGIVVEGDQNVVDWRNGVLENTAPKITTKGSGNSIITFDEALAKQK